MTIQEIAFRHQPIPCQVIDAHTHITPYYLNGWHEPYHQTNTGILLAFLERLGIDCIVTAPHPLVQGRMQEANALASQAIAEYPSKVYGYISVVPQCGMDMVRSELKKYGTAPGFLGLKFLTGYHGDLQQREYRYAMDFADEMGCPVLCHVWGNIPDHRGFDAALKTRNHMQLIIAHQGGGYASDSRDCAETVRGHENCWLELCGSLYNQYGIDELAELVGVKKIIFGTDCISLDPRYELGRVAFSPLSDSEKGLVFSGNYLRLLQHSKMGKIL